jgi:membrane-bound ClpP family serine protease
LEGVVTTLFAVTGLLQRGMRLSKEVKVVYTTTCAALSLSLSVCVSVFVFFLKLLRWRSTPSDGERKEIGIVVLIVVCLLGG